jgi:ribosome modulation factor
MDLKMDAWMDYRKMDEYIWLGGWMEGKNDR